MVIKVVQLLRSDEQRLLWSSHRGRRALRDCRYLVVCAVSDVKLDQSTLVVDYDGIRLEDEALLQMKLHLGDVERAGLEIQLKELPLFLLFCLHLQLLLLLGSESRWLWACWRQLQHVVASVLALYVLRGRLAHGRLIPVVVCIGAATDRWPVASAASSDSRSNLAILGHRVRIGHLQQFGPLIILRFLHHQVDLLILLAFALSSSRLPFVVVIFVEVFAMLRVEVGLGLVRPRGISRRVGILGLARASLVPMMRL